MSKHTPGPWQVTQTDSMGNMVDYANIRPANGILCGHPSCLPIVDVYLWHEEEQRANAHLMAASPDLLSDLEEAAATLRRYEALHRAKNTEESTTKAEMNAALATRFEATIRKAKGEQA